MKGSKNMTILHYVSLAHSHFSHSHKSMAAQLPNVIAMDYDCQDSTQFMTKIKISALVVVSSINETAFDIVGTVVKILLKLKLV